MSPNGSLVPMYPGGIGFPLGAPLGEGSEQGQQDVMAILQAMTQNGLRNEHLGHPALSASLRSNEWPLLQQQDWSGRSPGAPEGQDKRSWPDQTNGGNLVSPYMIQKPLLLSRPTMPGEMSPVSVLTVDTISVLPSAHDLQSIRR
eukprot:Blabericola_migrator_1__699@NODE_1174_length_5213_cov_40_985037_g798_i0_p4_GENE_NODE_1174_length_5213_cov_40_985037_g798_i0NODE_1174_length_5213_cov_40_985037_g798_i0_p4_ORF_typecomplete_len145_score16_32_NODE_1174_length_5213_cov_40_985037_g798_i016732107